MIRACTKANRGGAPRKRPLSDLGQRIDALAQQRGMTIGQVAAAAGISRQSLGMIRSGKTAAPSTGTSIALAKALGTTVDRLFSGLDGANRGRPRTLQASFFGLAVQQRMQEIGITRPELAKRCGIDHVTLWRWMRGKHRIPVDGLSRVAKGLRCDPTDLVSMR